MGYRLHNLPHINETLKKKKSLEHIYIYKKYIYKKKPPWITDNDVSLDPSNKKYYLCLE